MDTRTETSVGSRPAPHVPPSLGGTVDKIMREFIRISDEWCGLAVIEALLPVTNAGPARRYRVQVGGLYGTRTRIGVATHHGFGIRDATPAEEAELEECLALGYVQIQRLPGRGRPVQVLHQATGRRLAPAPV